MGKGAALKLAPPETRCDGVQQPQKQCRNAFLPEQDYQQGLTDVGLDFFDHDVFGGLDDSFLATYGTGRPSDGFGNHQPFRDVNDWGACNDAADTVPPFGSLAVDALFQPFAAAAASGVPALPGLQAVCPAVPAPATEVTHVPSLEADVTSPLKSDARISPWSSPLRAPGSPRQSPCNSQHIDQCPPAPLPRQASVPHLSSLSPSALPLPPPAKQLRVSHRCDIPTAFAAPAVDKLILFRSPAPKRKVEDDAESEDSSSVTCATPSWDALPDAKELIAPAVSTVQELEDLLPSIPTQQPTADGCIVYILPTLWRSHHPPFRIHMSFGLSSMRAPTAEAPTTYYGSINPRVVTTGCGHISCRSSHHQSVVEATSAVATRACRKSKGLSCRAAETDSQEAHGGTPNAELSLQEAWLLQRSLEVTTAGELLSSHHLVGLQCKSTISGTEAPLWDGKGWAVDVVALIVAPTGQTFWLKAVNRAIQIMNE